MMQGGAKFGRWRRATASTRNAPGPLSPDKARMLKRLDELIEFFRKSPFFEDEGARELLLKELEEERAAWEVRRFDEIAPP